MRDSSGGVARVCGLRVRRSSAFPGLVIRPLQQKLTLIGEHRAHARHGNDDCRRQQTRSPAKPLWMERDIQTSLQRCIMDPRYVLELLEHFLFLWMHTAPRDKHIGTHLPRNTIAECVKSRDSFS